LLTLGNDAEAARLAVAKNLNVKLFIDDNNVTIAGHPKEYLNGYTPAKTLQGHGLPVIHADGECIDSVYNAVRTASISDGPYAVIISRPMAPGTDIYIYIHISSLSFLCYNMICNNL